MKLKALLLLPAILALSGCFQNNTERGLAGAAGGVVIVGVTGGSALAGAVLGGAAGYLCNGANVPGCENR